MMSYKNLKIVNLESFLDQTIQELHLSLKQNGNEAKLKEGLISSYQKVLDLLDYIAVVEEKNAELKADLEVKSKELENMKSYMINLQPSDSNPCFSNPMCETEGKELEPLRSKLYGPSKADLHLDEVVEINDGSQEIIYTDVLEENCSKNVNNKQHVPNDHQDFDFLRAYEKEEGKDVSVKQNNVLSVLEKCQKLYVEPVFPGLDHLVKGACGRGLWKPCIQFLCNNLKSYLAPYMQLACVWESDDFLTSAAKQGLDDLIAVLLANGMSPNQALNHLGTVLLHTAAIYHHTPLVLLLLEKGASTEKQDNYRKTALHYAAEYGYLDICYILVCYEANINVKDHYDRTPLHYAVLSRREDLVDMFLDDSRCDKNVIDFFGLKALDYADLE